MIDVLSFARISQAVYSGIHDVSSELKNEPAWAQVDDISQYVHLNDEFYARIFLYKDQKKPNYAVIAFRGSKYKCNYVVDTISWGNDIFGLGLKDITPSYFQKALSFYHLASLYLKEKYQLSDSNIFLTGHSLGGALAQLIIAKAHCPTRAVVFNSPGIGNFSGVDANLSSRILNINSKYGLINKIGKVIGDIKYYSVKEGEAEAKAYFDAQNKIDGMQASINAHHGFFENYSEMKQIEYTVPEMQSKILSFIFSQHSISNLIHAIIAQGDQMLTNVNNSTII